MTICLESLRIEPSTGKLSEATLIIHASDCSCLDDTSSLYFTFQLILVGITPLHDIMLRDFVTIHNVKSDYNTVKTIPHPEA